MNSSVWKKIIFACCIMGLLGLSFLYGENLENPDTVMQDYEGRLENLDVDTLKDSVNDNNEYEKDTASDRETAEQNTTEEEQESTNPFVQIVMNIKQIGRSSDTPSQKGKNLQDSKIAQKNASKAADRASKKNKKKSKKNSSKENNKKKKTTESRDNNPKENSNEPKQESAKPEENSDDQKTVVCTLSVSCEALLGHTDKLNDAKKKLVPEDGILLDAVPVTVKKGSSVFDVLKQATESNKIQFEYSFSPAYKTYYVEGIGNIYEFDAGSSAGWMYCVNNKFPGCSCSAYKVSDGDEIKWIYSCSFGKDVGIYVEE